MKSEGICEMVFRNNLLPSCITINFDDKKLRSVLKLNQTQQY